MSYSAFTEKQKRVIRNDLQLLFTPRAFSKSTIDDWKRLGINSFGREIKLERGSILLSEEGYNAVRRLSKLIGELPALANSVSISDVTGAVKAHYSDWVRRMLEPDGDEFVDPIFQELSTSIKDYEFLIKVEGLDLKDQDVIELGSTRIQRSDETLLRRVDFAKMDPEWVKKSFENNIWLVGKARGSNTVALERFQTRVVLSVGVLAVYAAVRYRDAFRRSRVHPLISFAVPSEAITLLKWETGGSNPSISRRWGREQDLPIDAASIQYLRKECFLDELAALPDRDQRTELQDAIVRSLYWLADAHGDRNPPMQFVKLWSCLECFFTVGHDNITEANATGIAAVLAFGGSRIVEPADYAAAKRRVRQLYKMRSKAVHSARFEHIATADVDELARWVGWIIISMVSFTQRGYINLRQVRDQSVRLDTQFSPVSQLPS